MVGVELVDSADLAELETANTPEPEAVDEAELDDALSRMIADLERSLEAAAVEAKEDAVAEDGTYVVKNGDYLDKIINQTVGQSPLRRNILRSAFVRANPHAFMRSNPNWLLANTASTRCGRHQEGQFYGRKSTPQNDGRGKSHELDSVPLMSRVLGPILPDLDTGECRKRQRSQWLRAVSTRCADAATTHGPERGTYATSSPTSPLSVASSGGSTPTAPAQPNALASGATPLADAPAAGIKRLTANRQCSYKLPLPGRLQRKIPYLLPYWP